MMAARHRGVISMVMVMVISSRDPVAGDTALLLGAKLDAEGFGLLGHGDRGPVAGVHHLLRRASVLATQKFGDGLKLRSFPRGLGGFGRLVLAGFLGLGLSRP